MHRAPPLARRLTGTVLLALVLLAGAPALADEPVSTYVFDFNVSKRVQVEGSTLTTSLCTRLFNDKALDTICPDDMNMLVGHSSSLEMFGAGDSGDGPGPAATIAKRLGGVKVLVHGRVREGKHGLILDVTVWERDPTFDGEILKVRRKHGHIQVKGIQDGVNGLLARIERLAPRIAALAKEEPKGPIPEGDLQ